MKATPPPTKDYDVNIVLYVNIPVAAYTLEDAKYDAIDKVIPIIEAVAGADIEVASIDARIA